MRIAFYLIIIACLLLFPGHTAKAAKDALVIWGLDVVPSLFPYMVFSRMLSLKLRRTHLPSGPIAVTLGILGGSPSGAAALASMSGKLSKRELLSLVALTGTISPMFFLGTILEWTGDAVLCRQLLLSHWIGAAFAGVCVHQILRSMSATATDSRSVSENSEQTNPISSSIDAVLQVGGCIICYSVLAGLTKLLPFSGGPVGAILHAVLEISGGLHAIIHAGMQEELRAVCLAAASGFGGLSILSQNHAFLVQRGVRMTHLLCFAMLRALGAAVSMTLLTSL